MQLLEILWITPYLSNNIFTSTPEHTFIFLIFGIPFGIVALTSLVLYKIYFYTESHSDPDH